MIHNFTIFSRKLIKRYLAHGIAAISAQMAYNWVLAFFPFLIFLITLASYTPISTKLILEYVSTVVPSSAMGVIESTVYQFVQYRSTTLLSVGVIISLWTASTAVKSMIRGIKLAYNDGQIRPFWLSRLIAIIYTVILAVLIITLIILLVFGNKLGLNVIDYLKLDKCSCLPVWNRIRLIVPVFLLLTALYLIYRFIPKQDIKYRSIWPGTLIITITWYAFTILFSLYIDNYASYNQMYGSIGSIFVLLIWLYASCTLLLIGAEINGLSQDLKMAKRGIIHRGK